MHIYKAPPTHDRDFSWVLSIGSGLLGLSPLDVSSLGPQPKGKTLRGHRYVPVSDLEAPSGWHPILSKAEWGNVLACTGLTRVPPLPDATPKPQAQAHKSGCL